MPKQISPFPQMTWREMSDPKPHDARPVLVAVRNHGFNIARWSASQNAWVTVMDYEAEWEDGLITHWADPLMPNGRPYPFSPYERSEP